jgi:hypothetical protein
MDSYREYPSEFDVTPASDNSSSPEPSGLEIGSDERRMHVRAYNYWVSLLEGRDFPSVEDLEPSDVSDFAAHSVLLDFTCGAENPAMPYLGAAIRDECGLDDDMRNISEVPSRSLLSRLTDHYMQIIANRAPIGFEAEFLNQRSANICYRGILMPFSSDGEQIDFIYGVINWKTVGEDSVSAEADAGVPVQEADEPGPDEVVLLENESVPVVEEIEVPEPEAVVEELDTAEHEAVVEELESAEPETVVEEHLTWEDGPSTEAQFDVPEGTEEALPRVPFAWEDDSVADAEPEQVAELVLDENAGLADHLWAARETAETVKAGEGRTRSALYKALSLAFDVAIVAQENPEEYAELLEESGVKAQARAPMTPIVKLVFGVDYDKARLTEFAAALSYAQRQQIELGGFKDFIEKQPGGLKALVAAERQARRPEPKPDTRGDAARARLRSAAPMSLSELPAGEEFALVITRRSADGSHDAVAVVDDEALVERAIRNAA